jgi:hypothetical protein
MCWELSEKLDGDHNSTFVLNNNDHEFMSGRFYDVITSLRHISRRLSVEIKRKQKQWGNQKICHQM